MITIPDYGVVTDSTAIIQALLDSASVGDTIEFSGPAYRITAGLRPKSGTFLLGKNTRIFCDDAGWAGMQAPNNLGLLNLNGVASVGVERFCFYGTKNADINHTPKLIYVNSCTDLTIRSCILQNNSFEGLWSGLNDTSLRVDIVGLRINNVGYPAGTYAALPSIQAAFNQSSVRNCIIDDVGTGIGINGTSVTVSDNRITNVKLYGIGTGDGGTCEGLVARNNDIEITSDPGVTRAAIQSGTTTFPSLFSGNKIKVTTNLGDRTPMGFAAYGSLFPIISDNSIDVTGAGTGIYVQAASSAPTTALIARNKIRMNNIGGAQAWGIQVIPGGTTRVLNITVRDNQIFGTSIDNGYAIDANANGGGTINAVFDRNIKDGGYIRIADLMVPYNQDNLLACSYDNLTGVGKKD